MLDGYRSVADVRFGWVHTRRRWCFACVVSFLSEEQRCLEAVGCCMGFLVVGQRARWRWETSPQDAPRSWLVGRVGVAWGERVLCLLWQLRASFASWFSIFIPSKLALCWQFVCGLWASSLAVAEDATLKACARRSVSAMALHLSGEARVEGYVIPCELFDNVGCLQCSCRPSWRK